MVHKPRETSLGGQQPAWRQPMARDLMAPDTDPTDEELALVMNEARDLAIKRRAISDAWIAERLA